MAYTKPKLTKMAPNLYEYILVKYDSQSQLLTVMHIMGYLSGTGTANCTESTQVSYKEDYFHKI
jgi:hypothetical protein